jgi:hypothetical protein
VPPALATTASGFDPSVSATPSSASSISDLIAASPYLRLYRGLADPAGADDVGPMPSGLSPLGRSTLGVAMPSRYSLSPWWLPTLSPAQTTSPELPNQFDQQSNGEGLAIAGNSEDVARVGSGMPPTPSSSASAEALPNMGAWPRSQGQGPSIIAVRYAPGEGPGRVDRTDPMTPGPILMDPGGDGSSPSQTGKEDCNLTDRWVTSSSCLPVRTFPILTP